MYWPSFTMTCTAHDSVTHDRARAHTHTKHRLLSVTTQRQRLQSQTVRLPGGHSVSQTQTSAAAAELVVIILRPSSPETVNGSVAPFTVIVYCRLTHRLSVCLPRWLLPAPAVDASSCFRLQALFTLATFQFPLIKYWLVQRDASSVTLQFSPHAVSHHNICLLYTSPSPRD